MKIPVRRTAGAVALLLGLAACSPGGAATTTTIALPASTTTTTEPLPELPPAPSTTTSLPPGVDPEQAADTADAVVALMRRTQSLRALEFLERPSVQIVDAATMRVLLDRLALAPLGTPEFALEQRLHDLLGMIPDGFSASALYEDYYDSLPVALFEYATNTLHVVVRPDGLSPLEESVVVRETVKALAAEYFGVTMDTAGVVSTAIDDAALARAALVEGDATYFQLLYLQQLDDDARADAALEARTVAWDAPGGTPRWLIERLAFPYDDGLDFVRRVVESGGIAALDRAYGAPPASSEHILHPERYLRGEAVRTVELAEAEVVGYELHAEGRFGELAWRAMLSRTLDPGILTQTVDGWRGDAYAAYGNGSEVGIAVKMEMTSEEDAIEVALAVIEHARTTLDAGDGIDLDGGILFDEGGPYLFIDRIDDEINLVVASSRPLGSALRALLG